MATCFIFVFSMPIVSAAEKTGQDIFRKQCSQCHALPDTKKLTSEQWVIKLKSMAPMAGLNKKQNTRVLGFLQSHSKKAIKIVSMAKEQRIFEQKCSLCHNTNRIFLTPLTQKSRRHIILRMQERAPSGWISSKDAHEILEYLTHGAPGAKKPVRKAVKGGPGAVFRTRCSACHTLERVYLKLDKSRKIGKAPAWMHIVKRMREKSPKWVSDKEAKQILKYLRGIKTRKKN